jgi:hypothetical protein
MQTHVNELKKQIDSLEWEGDFPKADSVKRELFFAEEKLKRGELYEPNF